MTSTNMNNVVEFRNGASIEVLLRTLLDDESSIKQLIAIVTNDEGRTYCCWTSMSNQDIVWMLHVLDNDIKDNLER